MVTRDVPDVNSASTERSGKAFVATGTPFPNGSPLLAATDVCSLFGINIEPDIECGIDSSR